MVALSFGGFRGKSRKLRILVRKEPNLNRGKATESQSKREDWHCPVVNRIVILCLSSVNIVICSVFMLLFASTKSLYHDYLRTPWIWINTSTSIQFPLKQRSILTIHVHSSVHNIMLLTLLEAMSETDRWVWIVSSWSRHQSSSSRVSPARWTTFHLQPSIGNCHVLPWHSSRRKVQIWRGGWRLGRTPMKAVETWQWLWWSPGWGSTCAWGAHWWGWCSCCERCANLPRSERFLHQVVVAMKHEESSMNTWAKGVTIRSSPCLGRSWMSWGLSPVFSTTEGCTCILISLDTTTGSRVFICYSYRRKKSLICCCFLNQN